MIDVAHIERRLPIPFETATVEDAMSPGIISCPPETPLRVVARMMATFNVHAVFVFEHRDGDDDAQLWGIVSDLDLVAAGRLDVDQRTAGASAVTPIVAVRTDAPLVRAADLMAQHGVAHLAVVEPASGRPLGVISTLDIARAIAVEHGAGETQASA
ncbi:MAG TPA: CBS domain-containing protein [Gaiellaceae bacterium]|jgi:CBS domain-containing protein